MSRSAESRCVTKCRIFSHVVSAVTVLVGISVLLGWLLGIPALTKILPGLATMKPNTAACFVLSGVSLWLIQLQLSEPKGPRIRNIQVARLLSGVVGLVGLLTLAEYLLRLNFSFDEVLFSSKLLDGGAAHPGRMAGATALGFLLLGASVLLSTTRGAYLAQSLSLLAALDGFVGSVGYVLSARSLYAVPPYSWMALHTAILFLLLGLATLTARPESGFMAVVTSPNLGGVMVRR